MSNPAVQSVRQAAPPGDILPTLFGHGYGSYQVRRGTFVFSFLVHLIAVALIVLGSMFLVTHKQEVQQQVMAVFSGNLTLPVSAKPVGGGGGGGDRDKLSAPKGSAPRFTAEQIAPPAMVIRNSAPKLAAEPTVVGPPQLQLPQTPQMGDPLASIVGPPSNGTGIGGGMGSGSGGGVGSGRGPGVGPGYGGGIGGGAYKVGGGVSAPRVLYAPDPEYSDEARRAKHQGTVVLWVVVGPDGRVRDVRVQRSLGMGLDERALEAVKNWKFEPARKDGQPVAVQINVEVNFRLY